MRFYVATTFDNWALAERYANALTSAGYTCTLPWWKYHPSQRPKGMPVDLQAIARQEVEAVEKSDLLFLLHPAKDGSHVELGVALANRAEVVVVGPDVDDETACIFYRHPAVMRIALEAEAFLTSGGPAKLADFIWHNRLAPWANAAYHELGTAAAIVEA
jgi:hypothetical protein